MIHKAIEILKARKSDAIKVIAVTVLCGSLNAVITPLFNMFSVGEIAFVKFIRPLVFLLLFSIPMILSLGFDRSVVFDSQFRHTFAEFSKMGYKYFWRVFGFSALWFGLTIVLAILMAMVSNGIFGRAIDNFYYSILTSLVHLLLIKYMYLVPAQIVVYDRSISESIKNVKYYQSREIKRFVLLCLAVNISLAILSNLTFFFMTHDSIPYVIYMICQTVVSAPMMFFLGVVAVLHVYEKFCSDSVVSPEIIVLNDSLYKECK